MNGFPFQQVKPNGFDLGVLLREGFQQTGTSVGASNSSGALSDGASLGGISPVIGSCLYIETITLFSLIDIQVWVQRANASLIANSAASALIPVQVGPTFGNPVVPLNCLLQEGESISFILKTPVSSGGGTNTLGFRAGLLGRRVTNDFSFDSKKAMMIIGDSITNTTGPTYGREFWHAKLQQKLSADKKPYRRITKGDGGWKTSHALVALNRGVFDVQYADSILIMLGTNETILTDFQANMPLISQYLRDIAPDAYKIFIGPPPRQDSLEVSVMQPLRTWLQSHVASLSDSKCVYVTAGEAFDRTNDSFYASSDGASGTRVHPNASGNDAIATALKTQLVSNGVWSKL